jgi:hypothetical protein
MTTMAYIQGQGGCVVLRFIVVFVAIVVGLCVASVLQTFHPHDNFFAVIMAINGHGQQQKNLATMDYIQGRLMCASVVDCCACSHCHCSLCGFSSANAALTQQLFCYDHGR